jgi:DNA-binding NtrC family response regulator
LEVLVAKGTFLEDLAARLMTFRVRLPALRERREDIPDLVRQFVRSRASQFGHMVRPPRVDPALMMALQNADWPYNLRQLDGTVQRLLIEADGGHELRLAHCVGDLDRLLESRGGRKAALTPALVFERMNELRSVTATARSLGVSRWTVYRYLERARNIALAAERLRSGKIPDAKSVS